ncbi:glutaminase [Schlegelella sp. S2-27]|uniref:Glutaminase n=1 Tax=Caldimonas mangrovi TaxID=2944811 RepID=A0ABT0YU64_9BURK|nr:glutaminase [Caldimonas mangrovi]MCM5682296.1 glutaminase [Caldimonas mangrovi]
MDYRPVLEQIHATVQPLLDQGRVASYIPELAAVPLRQFGMAIVTLDGRVHSVGDAQVAFSIQSISKLFALVLALQAEGDALWQRVGREPSGTPFNSLVQLESEAGKPRNPFINAGALVVTDILCSRYAVPENVVSESLQKLSGNPTLHYDARVARSERAHSDRNAAMAHFAKSFGNLRNPVDAVLDAYCRHCAITMNCEDLARAVLFLANRGVNPRNGERVLSASLSKRLSALMLTCGTYDAAGDFAFRVGLPAKSGVGGGIVAVIPDTCGICVWSPGLDESGNSHAGSLALEMLTTLTGRSIF